jgi:RNA polymerase sigma-70 factor, ECF subfamily
MTLTAGLDLPAPASETTAPASLEAPLRAVYAEHFPMVVRALRRLGVPEAELEDAVQDVFVVLFRRWSDFEGRSALKTWTYGIVLRVAKDYRRARERLARRIQGLTEAQGTQPPSADSPDAEVERREARRLIQAVLATLDHDHRELIVLVELEQLSVKEAAQALGLGIRSCQRRLRAAHHSLELGLAAALEDGKRTP